VFAQPSQGAFLAEIDWRLRSAWVLVTVPAFDIGAGKLMVHELNPGIPVQLVPMDELSQVLNQTPSGTVVTHRYFIRTQRQSRLPNLSASSVDIYDFEIQMLKQLP